MNKLFSVFTVVAILTLSSQGFAQGLPVPQFKKLGLFRSTYYYLLPESDFSKFKKTTYLRTMNGKIIAPVSKVYKQRLDIEGSGKLDDGRVVNYAGEVGGNVRYSVVNAPFGIGVRNCWLAPFRSIAVDPRYIPYGTKVYIPATEGMKLPDGTLHDGYWVATDTGGAIRRDRIDIFVGAGEKNGKYLIQQGIGHLEALKVYAVTNWPKAECIRTGRGGATRPNQNTQAYQMVD